MNTTSYLPQFCGMKDIINDQSRNYGLLTGWGLWLMALAAGLGYGVAWAQLWVENDPVATASNWGKAPSMPVIFLGSFITVGILDLIVALALYRIFLPVQKAWSVMVLGSRLIYTIGLFFALWPLFKVLVLNDHFQIQEEGITALQLFLARWSLSLIVFGFHLIALGVCFWYTGKPILWLINLLYLGGISYILVHGMPLMGESGIRFKAVAEPWLSIPMGVSELAMATWFLWAAYKAPRLTRTEPLSDTA